MVDEGSRDEGGDVPPEARNGDGMKAVVWHGPADVRVDEVEDPKIEEPTDAVIKVTSTAICGSDLHLYEILTPFMEEGDILGHEPMGIVEEVGTNVTSVKKGDRVVERRAHRRPFRPSRHRAARGVEARHPRRSGGDLTRRTR